MGRERLLYRPKVNLETQSYFHQHTCTIAAACNVRIGDRPVLRRIAAEPQLRGMASTAIAIDKTMPVCVAVNPSPLQLSANRKYFFQGSGGENIDAKKKKSERDSSDDVHLPFIAKLYWA